jgi:hypothetical protein
VEDVASIDPAFTMDLSPELPEGEEYRAEVLDAGASILAAAGFKPSPDVDLVPSQGGHFAFALPLQGIDSSSIAVIRVLRNGKELVRRTGTGASFPSLPSVERQEGRKVRIAWSPSDGPAVLVRHAATRQMLAYGEGGFVMADLEGSELLVDVSDGVSSREFRLGCP